MLCDCTTIVTPLYNLSSTPFTSPPSYRILLTYSECWGAEEFPSFIPPPITIGLNTGVEGDGGPCYRNTLCKNTCHISVAAQGPAFCYIHSGGLSKATWRFISAGWRNGLSQSSTPTAGHWRRRRWRRLEKACASRGVQSTPRTPTRSRVTRAVAFPPWLFKALIMSAISKPHHPTGALHLECLLSSTLMPARAELSSHGKHSRSPQYFFHVSFILPISFRQPLIPCKT